MRKNFRLSAGPVCLIGTVGAVFMTPIAAQEAIVPDNSAPAEASVPASDAPSPATLRTHDQLTTLVVTARRREENIQNLPVSITALSGDQLEQRNISDSNDLQLYTPSLQAFNYSGRDATVFALRGFNQEQGSAPSVATYFADAPLPRPGPYIANGTGVSPAFFSTRRMCRY
jgi:iron complex outermembrane receptor protein